MCVPCNTMQVIIIWTKFVQGRQQKTADRDGTVKVSLCVGCSNLLLEFSIFSFKKVWLLKSIIEHMKLISS